MYKTDLHINEDCMVSVKWYILILLLFLCIYIPIGLTRSVIPTEAYYGLYAKEILSTGTFAFKPRIRGFESYPLYSWLTSLFYQVGGISIFTTRLVSILSILGMSGAAWYNGMKFKGPNTGLVAALIVMTCPASVYFGTMATEYTLFAFLVSTAFFAWYGLSRVEKQWTLCWAISISFIFLAVTCSGMKAVLYFYVPILLLRRPLRALRRMYQWDHVVIFCIFSIGLYLWLVFFGETSKHFFKIFYFQKPFYSEYSYLNKKFIFSIMVFLFTFPWIFILWTPFCVAYHILEGKLAYFKYTRILTFSIFIPIFFIHSTRPADLLCLLPLISVGAAIHYIILFRRNHILFNKIFLVLKPIIYLTSAIEFFYALFTLYLPDLNIYHIPQFMTYYVLTSTSIIFLLTINMRQLKTKIPYSFKMSIILGCFFILLMIAFEIPAYSILNKPKVIALQLSKNIPKNVRVYKLVKESMLIEAFYIKRHIININSEKQIPANINKVYVLYGHKPPIQETRTWLKKSKTIMFHDKKIAIWEGILRPSLIKKMKD